MWNLFSGRKKVADGVVALVRRVDGIGLAHVCFDAVAHRPLLVHCRFYPVVDPPSWKRVVTRLVRGCGLGKARFVGLLDRNTYLLFPADAPNVPRAEWELNMRWKIGDRIQYPVEQAVVEVFDLPGRAPTEDSGKIYVVVARDTDVQKAAALFLQAGLELVSMDIPELAFGRLVEGLEEDGRGVGLLHLEPDNGLVVVCRNRGLFLARTIETPLYRVLQVLATSTQTPTTSVELDGTLNALVMALHQIFEFYESQFLQPPLEVLFVTPLPFANPQYPELSHHALHFQALLADRLEMRVRYLPVEAIVQCAEGIQSAEVIPCLPAIGAALGLATGV